MVKLMDDYIKNSNQFKNAKIKVPFFDQKQIERNTKNNPVWVHFGGGNLFRCFHAVVAQELLNQGEMNSGVIVAETYDEQVIDEIYHRYSNRFLAVTMNSNGTFDKELIGSVAESLYFNASNIEGWATLTKIFENPSLQFATLSITEKGYLLHDSQGQLTEQAKLDMLGKEKPLTNMGALTYLLYSRYKAGKLPIAMVSTDNFSENGRKLEIAIMTIAKGWLKNGKVEQGFLDYLQDRKKVTFPWSMIDRITPNPSEKVAQLLKADGFEDVEILHSRKYTNIAPFGNTEEVHYLVIEDDFPNGRPALEKADGVILANRDVVNDTDQMKVTACLNPLHTALAIFGCLLDYHAISDEMEDEDLLALIKNLGYGEALPVVKNPQIITPNDFIDQLINKRLPNKNIPDTPQRIATDTSQKLSIRYGVTIDHYISKHTISVEDLNFIPLVIAAWCRYLLGVNDNLIEFTLSPDPLLEELQPYVRNIQIGDKTQDIHGALQPILSNTKIFGHNLYEIGLSEKIENFFTDMIKGKGAVRATLKKAIEDYGKDFK